MTSDVNAWAMANGCVRVYSGLMDMMNDNEIEGVLGHELGHVALGHLLAETSFYALLPHAMPFQLPAVWLPSFPAHNWVISQKARSTQHSRDKESEADDFSFDLLKKRGISTQGLVGSFEKLASLDGGLTSPCLTLTHHQQSVRNTSVIVSPLVSKSLSSFGLVFCQPEELRNKSPSEYRQNWFLHTTLTICGVGAYNARGYVNGTPVLRR